MGMPHADLSELPLAVRQPSAKSPVSVVVADDHPSGAKGYLVKAADPQEIREAVGRVAKGETFFPSEIGLKLAKAISSPRLSKREMEVLESLGSGKVLYISEHTAKAHVRAIMTKLNADSRAEVIAIATKHGLIKAVPG